MRLQRGEDDLSSLELAVTIRSRTRGLLGRDGFDGALLLSPASSVHTIGMRFAIDVAHLDAELCVLRTTTMRPHRIGRPVRRSRHVLEAEAGSFARWGLRIGDRLVVVDGASPAGLPAGRRTGTGGEDG